MLEQKYIIKSCMKLKSNFIRKFNSFIKETKDYLQQKKINK